MKYILLLGACFWWGMNATAHNNDTNGIDIGLDLTSELQATSQGNYNCANLLHLNASLPIGHNLTIEASSISTYMTASESIGGDLQTFSNLDAGNIPFALSVCDIAWQINDRHVLYAGIRNMSEDYFTSPVTSFFTNSSCGIYPTISANYSIANYPMASVGVHYCYDGHPFSVQASLYNGMGYNDFTGGNNVFRFCPKSDGLFGLAQVEYEHNGSCYFLGNSICYNNGTGVTPWLYVEQKIGDNLTLLAGYSHAFAVGAECKDFVGLGLHYRKEKCELGIFSDLAHFEDIKEFATEFSGKYYFSQHFYFQPSLHALFTGDAFNAVACMRLGIRW